jgi:hypothetical protein
MSLFRYIRDSQVLPDGNFYVTPDQMKRIRL